MNLSPEIKQQLAEQKKQCIFCKIISKEMEGKVVFEDDKTTSMLDIYPALKGHTLFMLKEHYPIMPYIPADEFKHYFGMLPQLCKSVQEAVVTTGVNIFIANGGVAGQQSPHFLLHVLPREAGDGFFNFLFNPKEKLEEEKVKMLAHNFPIMMQNHFGRNPAPWHKGTGDMPTFLEDVYNNSKVIYEDEKVLCVIPEKSLVPGQIEIYSKIEEEDFTKLSSEDSAHLFYTASFAATAVFEGLGAQGTNIILKSGKSDDNPNGKLVVHILPRMQDDSLKSLHWEPKQPEYDLDAVAERIKDKTWKIEEKKKTKVTEPEVIKISSNQPDVNEEIMKAIERIK